MIHFYSIKYLKSYSKAAAMNLQFVIWIISVVVIGSSNGQSVPEIAEKHPNILFIVVDDLRPQLGCYGQAQMITPNIDHLAAEGFLFERAYCQVPVCGASRASVLTGLRPSRSRFTDYKTWTDQDAPNVMDLPQYLKNSGYHTISNGKVYHHLTDRQVSWSEKPWRPKGDWVGRGYLLEENKSIALHTTKGTGPAFERAEVGDDAYPDGKMTNKTISDLHRLKTLGKPFFLAVGYLKPHLPFNAPNKYWDLYQQDSIDLADNPFRPKDAPDIALHNWGELRQYVGIPEKGPLSVKMAKTMIHGYYACVSYTDAQIGRLLDELERLGLKENTIVVLWGDHGWNLGEHGLWCKHALFETSLHAPLIVRVPWSKSTRRIKALTEFVDIYPSICELAGLPLPLHLDGKSFIPLLKDPSLPGKEYVFSRFKKGESIKTNRYRYSEWQKESGRNYDRMMYDHFTDLQENVNISEQSENNNLIREFSKKLKNIH